PAKRLSGTHDYRLRNLADPWPWVPATGHPSRLRDGDPARDDATQLAAMLRAKVSLDFWHEQHTRGFGLPLDPAAPVDNVHATLGEQLGRRGIAAVLGCESAPREPLGGVVLAHRHRRLGQDRAGIHLRHHEMHRGAMDLYAGRKRARVGIEALERR